jgi:spore coat polysaccharide biosynthesis protein SpsF (cytidylyltransferase family)
MEMKAHAIIQARFGASRLPGKVMLKVLDKTILEYVIERVSAAKLIESVIIATTSNGEDSRIADLADRLGVNVYRGSEDDVLDRFYQAAKKIGAKHIVRITADCPLIDPRIIDRVVGRYFESKADYCSNIIEETFPDGEDVEVFSFKALNAAWEKAHLVSEREHVTPYIKNHPADFKLVNVKNRPNLYEKRWTVDRKEDFIFIKTILEAIYPGKNIFHMEDVLGFLKANPKVEDINRHIVRNEGYLKSLKEDREMYG